MLVTKHKRFGLPRPRFYWTSRAFHEDQERLRGDQVEAFLNAVGAANVVAVTESFAYGYLEITVWYREGAEG